MPIQKPFDAHYVPEPNTGCWLWTGSATLRGYGRFRLPGGETKYAHRVMYERERGDISEGMVVCHRCDTPSCVNPDHLFLGTQRDNLRDCAKKGRVANQWQGVTHCIRGHEFTAENTVWGKPPRTRDGVNASRVWRACRKCNNARRRKGAA